MFVTAKTLFNGYVEVKARYSLSIAKAENDAFDILENIKKELTLASFNVENRVKALYKIKFCIKSIFQKGLYTVLHLIHFDGVYMKNGR